MKLLRVQVIAADTCGGLLDGLDLSLRTHDVDDAAFTPLCLVGPNGTGKSQLLQIIAEIFQSLFHACVPSEERLEGNPGLQFEIEYLIRPPDSQVVIHVRVRRSLDAKKKLRLVVEERGSGGWQAHEATSEKSKRLLPERVVGYTSGDNETLSLPFLVSRSGYATEVATRALRDASSAEVVPDTRLMLIDYGTHLEVLAANLLVGDDDQRAALLEEPDLSDLDSFRCIVQLAHRAVPKLPRGRASDARRKGVQLTEELELYLDQLRRCASCYEYQERTETYVFDYWVDNQTREAFRYFWETTEQLYSALHKLSMLNDLAIPKATRVRFRRDTSRRRFASRLPEPQDEEKIFRFEEVRFRPSEPGEVVDYVSLSDGEHQLAQLLGTMCMVSSPRVLFLLDEPESHFNPRWRVQFISRLLALRTARGARGDVAADVTRQECLMTTHAPFVPSDMSREQVLVFGKDVDGVRVRRPKMETYGTTFDSILEECFDVRPPIAQLSRSELERLMQSDDPGEIRRGLERLGHSVDKVFLADRLRQLTEGGET